MKRLLKYIPLIFLFFIIPAANCLSETYHIDPSGSDTTGDGSTDYPWHTIQHAVGEIGAGDTLLINPGTYSGPIVMETDGTAANPITFRGNGTGAIIQGSGLGWDAFYINHADYIVVENLTIQQATRAGIRLSYSHHVTARNCTFADNGRWGFFTDFSDYTTVENCRSHGAVLEHGIYISNSSDHATISGNTLHHNNGCGLHMNGDISMGGDGVISNALVEKNIIYENGTGGGSGINMDGVCDSIVRNNLLYDNHASGISLYQIDGGSGSMNNRVLNNTIIQPADGRWGINIPGTVNTGNKVFNNIVFTNHSWRGCILIGSAGLTGFESDYNVVMDRFSVDDGSSVITLTQWRGYGYGVYSMVLTPGQVFRNAAGHDYRLKMSSPAIDAGCVLSDVNDDLTGQPRPVGSGFDMGAYELRPATIVPSIIHLLFL